MPRTLTPEEVTRQLAELDGWETEDGQIVRRVELADFDAALDFVVQVGHEAQNMDHHPDIDIRFNLVRLAVSTHSEGGLTQLDIELAHRVNALLG